LARQRPPRASEPPASNSAARASQRAQASKAARFGALRSANFRSVWLGLIVANVGGQMQWAAQAWLVREMHSEPFYLGLLSASFGLPMLLLTPFGGAIADRFSWRVLTWTRLGMAIQGIILALLVIGGWIELWHILALSFTNGVLLSIDNPTRQSIIPDLVPREDLSSAVSLSTITWSGAALFGPTLAGLLLGPLGAAGVFLLTALAYVWIIWAVSNLRGMPERPPREPRSFLGEVAYGLRYTASDRPTSLLLGLLTGNNVLGRSYSALMPIFARDVLGTGPEGYGLLLAAPGAGSLVGGFGLAAVRNSRQSLVSQVGWFGFVGGLLGFAYSRDLGLSLALLFLVGAFSTLLGASMSTVVQLRTPPRVRGRVSSLLTTSNIGGGQMGGALSASLATFLGASGAVAAGGLILLAMGVAVSVRRAWGLGHETQPEPPD
jgi:MFS family permease